MRHDLAGLQVEAQRRGDPGPEGRILALPNALEPTDVFRR
jgi:hypothetical protein